MAHLAEPTALHASHFPIPDNTQDSHPTTAAEAVLDAVQKEPTVQELYSLKGRTALVTGGAGGLGCTLAGALLEAGAHVYCLDIQTQPSSQEWEAIAERAKSNGLTLEYRKADITDGEGINTLVQAIAREAPAPLRVLMHCAAIQQELPALDYPHADIRRIMEVNITGTYIVAQACARVMMQHGQKSSIVLVASMSGQIANRGLSCSAYNTSKGAVHQLSRSLSAEWSGRGIRVNTLSPGYIKTAMTAQLLAAKPALTEQWTGDNPMGRIGLPWEFKGPALFLASDASSFATGTDLRIDGGHCAW